MRLISRGLAVALFAMLGSAASAQTLNYDATVFVPGLGAGNQFWTRENTLNRLAQSVLLKQAYTYNPGTTDFVANQSSNLQQALGSGQWVLACHSLGGVVCRNAAINSSQVAGVLTVATPHQGAPVANNLPTIANYIVLTSQRILEAVLLGWAPLGPTALVPVYLLGDAIVQGKVKYYLDSFGGAGAVSDARTSSPAIAYNVSTMDAKAHAAVYGTISRRHAWMSVAASAVYGNHSQLPHYIRTYQAATNVLKGCALFRLFIAPSPLGVFCARGYHAAISVDERWHMLTTNNGGAFDGLIPNWSHPYPGTQLADPTNVQVLDVDHNMLVTHPNGINAMAAQMRNRMRMLEPTP